MSMFTHVTVGTNDIAKARKFYDAILKPLGYTRTADLSENGSIWGQNGSIEFFVLKPANGQPATLGNGVTVSFSAHNRAAVTAFHKAALEHGGKDEGAVGPRSWKENAYAAYVRDPDGNKLAVYTFNPQ
jgi:catechol 2,3-dioxygenase-like lactoylglutathione lyase family enzyme